MNLEWLKKHPYAAAAGALALLVIFVLLVRRSGSGGSSLAGAIAAQSQGQLQMAQLNAQLGAQSEQTQAQLAATEFQTQAQQQTQQDALAGNLIGTIIPIQEQSSLYEQELAAMQKQQELLLPLESTVIAQVGKGGSLETAGVNELSILLGQGAAGGFNNLPGGQRSPSSLGLFLGGLGSSLGHIGTGLFG